MKQDRAIKWTNEKLRLEALKYTTRTEFSKFSKAAYMAAWKKGILDEICAHMNTKPRKKKGHWDIFENLKQAAIECKKLEVLRRHPAYPHILKHPRKDEILSLVTYRKEHITDDVFKQRKLEIESKSNLKCIDDIYSGVNNKYQFECLNCQYRWKAIWDNVYSGKSNCPQCAGLAKRTIEEMQEKARSKGGFCYATVYTNIKDIYSFSCVENHYFELDGEAFLSRNSWCPYCYENPLKGKYKNSIEDIKKLVELKLGCLKSTIYQGMHKKYNVICGNGHPFKISGANLYSGKWCSQCKNPNENFCRTVLEQMFGIELPKKRPKWLYNLTGKRLELDGYCPTKQIAFEYNGLQHYEFVSAFHSQGKGIEEQQERDNQKVKACEKYGVSLIVVPFFQESLSIDERIQYIESIVLSLDLKIIPSYYDLKRNKKIKFISPEIDKLKKKISDRGGVLKDNVYIDSMHPITVICSEGHEWTSRGEYINQGSWCKECYIESIRKN